MYCGDPTVWVVLGQPDGIARRRRRRVGRRRLARRTCRAGQAVLGQRLGRRRGQVVDGRQPLRQHHALEQLGDPEVEQLGQELAGALDHHDARWLEIAVHDAAIVRGVHDLGDALEEHHELPERHRAVPGQPLGKRDSLHALHGDPQQLVPLLMPNA
jgi:hypothetical protein